ncbi:MAG: hypothetical protein P4M14_01775 [Gammaproteobacteria bacterium]|nr:hypothetical protein [Gammaproteobacteria bacterium]
MRKILITTAVSFCLMASGAYAGVLTDSDMPALKEALKKSYTLQLCQQDIPKASQQTCDCLGQAMADGLNTEKLKLCNKEGYDDCVAAEFSATKSGLTDKQITDCKMLTKEDSTAADKKEDDKSADNAATE